MFAYQLSNTFPHLTTTSCAHELMNTVDHGIFLSVKYANMGNADVFMVLLTTIALLVYLQRSTMKSINKAISIMPLLIFA